MYVYPSTGGVESAEGKDMEMEGGTPPPESPEGPGKGDGDGGRSGVPPAPRLEHHATGYRSDFV